MIVEEDCLLFWIYDKKALNITVKEFIRAAKFYYLKGRNFRGKNVWVWQAQKLRIIFVTEFSLRTSRNLFLRRTDLKRCKGK